MNLDERFDSKWKLSPTGCHLWTDCTSSHGYGQFWIGTRTVGPHRWAWERVHGPVPEGLQIDHLCRVRHCVNPAHLEVVTSRENTRRGDAGMVVAEMMRSKTHCPQGHPYDEANTHHYRGKRVCRTCKREKMRARRADGRAH